MRKKIIWFASSNKHKIKEVQQFLSYYGYEVKSLLDIKLPLNIEETGKTYAENALIKAKTLANYVKKPVIAEDSGLEVKALLGFPGLYSKRWKKEMSDKQAMEKIIADIKNKNNYDAKMIATVVYFDPYETKKKQIFVGELHGKLLNHVPNDSIAFDYDPIFFVPSEQKTLSQITTNKKNKISHRGKALKQLVNYLQKLSENE